MLAGRLLPGRRMPSAGEVRRCSRTLRGAVRDDAKALQGRVEARPAHRRGILGGILIRRQPSRPNNPSMKTPLVAGFSNPERFPAKWTPVRAKKTRQNKELEPRSDSIGTEKALASDA